MKIKKYLFLFISLLVVSVFIFVGSKGAPKNQAVLDLKYVKLSDQTLKVDLALSPEAQEQGLSGRTDLKENEGMLFVFKRPGKYSFWMKDMNFPIDMIWIGEDLRVTYIQRNAKPESYPASFAPKEDSLYVLEVVSGFSEKNNLKIGDRVEFLP